MLARNVRAAPLRLHLRHDLELVVAGAGGDDDAIRPSCGTGHSWHACITEASAREGKCEEFMQYHAPGTYWPLANTGWPPCRVKGQYEQSDIHT